MKMKTRSFVFIFGVFILATCRTVYSRKQSITSIETTSISNPSTEQPSTTTSDPQVRRACRLFIWDVPSALLYRWCNHLQKGCEYEGRGGKRFVRIRPGSMLQALYPCSRYAPDRCLVCGGKYLDHLTLWWFKHMYSPLDQMLDRDLKEGVIMTDPHASDKRPNNHRKRGKRQVPSDDGPTIQFQYPLFVYHRRYVFDFGEMLEKYERKHPRLAFSTTTAKAQSQRRKAFQKAFRERYPGHHPDMETYGILNIQHVFAVPRLSSTGKTASIPLAIVRAVVIGSVANMMQVEKLEQDWLLRKHIR